MKSTLPSLKFFKKPFNRLKNELLDLIFIFKQKLIIKKKLFLVISLDLLILAVLFMTIPRPAQQLISSLSSFQNLEPLKNDKSGYEVFGFAPYWTFNKLDNVNFDVLTTFAYFGVEVDSQGNLDREGQGYQTFKSDLATEVFKKAHAHGTRVVLTLTQMDNANIEALMDDQEGQRRLIDETVTEVKSRGIDGVNVDFEYMGDPGQDYRDKFTNFISNLTQKLHQEIPGSKVSVSVYASAIKDPKIYDITALGKMDIKIFMMAYDFAVAGSKNAIPTSPLYGYKEGKYWYDVSTAVEHFLTQMPSHKLILGVPWYGYNYAVEGVPAVKASVNKGYTAYYKKGRRTYSYFVPIRSRAQTYSIVQEDVVEENADFVDFQTGWDDFGQVGWKAYQTEGGIWRMVFIDDTKSLKIKYDFAKDQKLAGVGMWALGFDDGKFEMWTLLKDAFGTKYSADRNIVNRVIN